MSLQKISPECSSMFAEWIVPTMRKALSDRSSYVRMTYARVIGHIGTISNDAMPRF